MTSRFVASPKKGIRPRFVGYQADTVVQGLPPREAPKPVPDVQGGIYANTEQFKDIVKRGAQNPESLTKEEQKQLETAVDQHPEIRQYVEQSQSSHKGSDRVDNIVNNLGLMVKNARAMIALGIPAGNSFVPNPQASIEFVKAADRVATDLLSDAPGGLASTSKALTGKNLTEIVAEGFADIGMEPIKAGAKYTGFDIAKAPMPGEVVNVEMPSQVRLARNFVLGAARLAPQLLVGLIDNPLEFAYGLAKFPVQEVNLIVVASNGLGTGAYTAEEVAQAREELMQNPVGIAMLGFAAAGIGGKMVEGWTKIPVEESAFEKFTTDLSEAKSKIAKAEKPKPAVPEAKKVAEADRSVPITEEELTKAEEEVRTAKGKVDAQRGLIDQFSEVKAETKSGKAEVRAALEGFKKNLSEGHRGLEIAESNLKSLQGRPVIKKPPKVETPAKPGAKEQESGDVFEGQAFRAETNLMVKGKTAKEIVDFEVKELGNEPTGTEAYAVAKKYGIDLAKVSEEDVVWVTKTKEEAARYGVEEGDARSYPLTGENIILSADGDGGYLILRNAERYKTKPKAPIIDKTAVEPSPDRPEIVETGNNSTDAARNLAHSKRYLKSLEDELAKPDTKYDRPKMEKDLKVAKADVDKFQEKFDEESSKLQKPKFSAFKDVPVVIRKLSDIKLDPERFQNRAVEYVEDKAQHISDNFDPVKFDPIIIWKDPKDGETYLLSGHTRREGATRKGVESIPTKEFKGTVAEAQHFAKVEANRLQTRETLTEDIEAYKSAVKEGKSNKALKNVFGRQLSWLEAYSKLDSKGKFLDVLMQEDARKSFPYLEQKARDVGELRRDFPELTNRHEQQIFDAMYGETKMREMPKADFRDIIEKQVTDALWNSDNPLVFRRGQVSKTGTRARKDTGAIVKKIDDLEALWDKARTLPEKESLAKEITKLRAGVAEIVDKQQDIFNNLEAEVNKSITLSSSGITPEAMAELGKDIANITKSISSSMTSLVNDMKTNPKVKFGVSEVLNVLIDHDRQIRSAEFTAKQLEKLINDTVPDKGRQLLLTKALEDNLQGKHWEELTDLEKAMGRFLETVKDKTNQFISDNNIVEMLPETNTFRHIKHVWENEKTLKPYRAYYGKFSKTAVGGHQRTVTTIPEGEARGLVFAVPNPGKLLGLELIDMTRAQQARNVFKSVHSVGADPATNIVLTKGGKPQPIRMVERWDLLEKQGLTDGYVRYSHPALDKTLVWKSPDGKTKIFKGAVGVKEEIYPFLKAYMESPQYGLLSKLNFVSKTLKLGLSLFHPVMLGWQELTVGRVPFKNIPRGLRIRKELGPEMKLLHQEGLELFKGYEDFGGQDKFFEGTTFIGETGNVITTPVTLMRDLIFEVVQPGMKVSYTFDLLHKYLPKYLEGTGWTKEEVFRAIVEGDPIPEEARKAARAVVKVGDGHFSGEHYKRSLLETNRTVVKLFFTPAARKFWQNILQSFTWQREHLLIAKDVAKSFMPDPMIKKLGLAEIGPIKAEYRRYAYGAILMILPAVDLWNQMNTQAMDGESKHLWENPEGKGFAIRSRYNEPDYTVTDKNGKERIVRGGPAYMRPLKSIFEVAEWTKDPFRKLAWKLSPAISAIGRQLFPSRYQKEYKGIEDIPRRAKDFILDVSTPMSVEQWIDVYQGKKQPISGILPFFGMPTSKVKDKSRGSEINAIMDLYIEKKPEEARLRIAQWNKRRPNERIMGGDINSSKIVARAKYKMKRDK